MKKKERNTHKSHNPILTFPLHSLAPAVAHTVMKFVFGVSVEVSLML